MTDTEPTTMVAATSAPRNVIDALARITSELPAIGKDSLMSGGGQSYKYRGIEAITAELAPLLGRYGVVLIPRLHSAEPADFQTKAGDPIIEWRCLISYTVYGPGGVDDHIEAGPVYAIARDASDKGIQKTMTSAFKQVLLQMFCVSDKNDDIDGSHIETVLSEDQLAQRDGWRDVSEWLASRDKLTAVIEGLDERTRTRFQKWCADEGLRMPGPKAHWERAYAKVLEKANPGRAVTTDPLGGPGAGDPVIGEPGSAPLFCPTCDHPASLHDTDGFCWDGIPDGSAKPLGEAPCPCPGWVPGAEVVESPTGDSVEHDPASLLVEGIIADVQGLKAQAVDEQLRTRELPTDGNVDTRRQRLAKAMMKEQAVAAHPDIDRVERAQQSLEDAKAARAGAEA